MEGTMELLPIEIAYTVPKLDKSADCKAYCIGTDSNKYAVKTTSDNPDYPFAPFDELFCYELARHCGVAVPQYNLLLDKNGQYAFGSAFEGGVVDNGIIAILTEIIKQQIAPEAIDVYIQKLTTIYVLDLFVHNEDRHKDNYLVKDVGGQKALMAMDFGRSWTSLNCPIDRTGDFSPTRLPFYYLSPPHPTNNDPSNTWKAAHFIWSPNCLGGLSGKTLFDTLEKLDNLTPNKLRYILRKSPDEWCSEDRKLRIIEWWGSTSFKERIDAIKLGFTNGNLVSLHSASGLPR
ncbi:hypothetical protein [Neptuniibacter sp.]|uniref:hypothetical protein n=1 Tax=Neptuniibacter sp. TaxID=1962643 RepID=UPI00260B211E|nr:hypothetical protein [Neptuniibacter sp.]MCP4596166.1 HipA domain-containing protein [Neptuniibacter sp.]